jgi:hypothetical protein
MKVLSIIAQRQRRICRKGRVKRVSRCSIGDGPADSAGERNLPFGGVKTVDPNFSGAKFGVDRFAQGLT